MNKIVSLILLISLTALHTDAKKTKKEEVDTQQKALEESNEAEDPEAGAAEFPGFALRIPIPNLGALAHIRQQLENLFPGPKQADYKPGKTKTTTTSKNSTHGPFKTYSVTEETVSTDNKSSPHVLSKVYKSITTLDKDKLPKGKDGKVKIPSAMEFDFGPFGPQFHDEGGKKCSASSECGNVEYCDAFFGVCKKRLSDGAACTQKDQCEDKYRCTWGRCIKNSEEGSSGTFCDSDSDCHSADEELSCREQPDISRYFRLCMAKLGEGATCGHAGLFDLFRPAEEVSNYCKKGLVCKTVGFFGRKACIRPEETKSIDDEVSKKEIKPSKAGKTGKEKKIKF
ncbi:hypothetical protein pdam_00014400 [Pocillopora damicornis]|uniref:Dickkopf N-terminal cysteine-rich domain-containing protein n=1 Tax=Pocillopora damicornis TaxID=46731 RepID=A0A3M6UFC3_POCDA|nr:uncharacterized protein LOC113664887 [Pocillopora damicornis]RMX52380.1 hypothetical protein pdam_00014400 [Pocillopora damicornis]